MLIKTLSIRNVSVLICKADSLKVKSNSKNALFYLFFLFITYFLIFCSDSNNQRLLVGDSGQIPVLGKGPKQTQSQKTIRLDRRF